MENETQKSSSETSQNRNSSMLEITGLWANKSKNGDTYYSGYMGKSAILIFKNNYKTEDKHPDLRMFVAEGKKKEGPALTQDSFSGNIGEPGGLVGRGPTAGGSSIPF